MKTKLLLIVATVLLAASSARAVIDLEFNNTAGSKIIFQNGSFSLSLGGNGYQFEIGNVLGTMGESYTGDSEGLKGNLINNGGSWTFSGYHKDATGEHALVSGGGVLSINDGKSHTLTGDFTWLTIDSQSVGNGSSGTLNLGAALNISNLKYDGGNDDLKTLVAQATQGEGTLTLVYNFPTLHTLQTLQAATVEIKNGYHGNITPAAVPEPSTVFAGALLVLPFGVSAYRSLRRNRE